MNVVKLVQPVRQVRRDLLAVQVREVNLEVQVLLDLEDNLANVVNQDYLVHKDHEAKMVVQDQLEEQEL